MIRAALGPNSSSNPMLGRAMYSYHAAYVSTVVIGTCIMAFTIAILIWRMVQRMRIESASSRGDLPFAAMCYQVAASIKAFICVVYLMLYA